MALPLDIPLNINAVGVPFSPSISLRVSSGLLTLIGPNGSGKTQLLRAVKQSISTFTNGKKVRYLSAGRMGLFEQYRSDFDGHRGNSPLYDEAQFGSKSDTDRRHNYETILGDFHTLSVRTDILVKVQERLKKLFNRSIFIEWDAGTLRISFKRNDQEKKAYSSAREASGLLHLVAILTSLYDDDIGALLLDEPEVSLHPQLQAFLMKEIRKSAGDIESGKKIVIMATHSTEFIDVRRSEELGNLVFCRDVSEAPIQLSADLEELKNRKLRELLSRMGQEHKLSFFCRRPLLVEGVSDSILCNGIDSKLDLYIEAAGAQIIPVIGKGEFPVVFKFMRILGKEPIILTDADTFTDGLDVTLLYSSNEKTNLSAQENGFADFAAFAKTLHADFCKIVEAEKGNFHTAFEHHAYWVNRSSDEETPKAERRAFFCMLFSDQDEIRSVVNANKNLVALKKRLIVLLELLEESGCFILRKGTIESYYRTSDRSKVDGKPLAAIEELDGIVGISTKEVELRYPEVVRCLKYAARIKTINEVESLRELLLAVLGPSLAILDDSTAQSDIDTTARNILGDRAKIFKILLHSSNRDTLVVSLDSKILETTCFPFEIHKGDNLVASVDKLLGLGRTPS